MAMRTYHDPLLAAPYRVMDELFRNWNANQVAGFNALLDVRETDEEYLVLVDLPGISADEVTIEVSDHVLSISGQRSPVETGDAQLSERPHGSFVRTLTLPQGVDEEKIAADYTDGVLKLHVPKPVAQRPKKISLGTDSQKAIS